MAALDFRHVFAVNDMRPVFRYIRIREMHHDVLFFKLCLQGLYADVCNGFVFLQALTSHFARTLFADGILSPYN